MNSKLPFVRSLFNADAVNEREKKTISVISTFRESLASLMIAIRKTSPHYVRCIKPNSEKKPGLFVKLDVLQQLRCGGVLESIRISKAGFPTRRVYEAFAPRYKLLVSV